MACAKKGGDIVSIPFKKYGYELNPITNEYKQPQIFLVDKRIHKIGELYPIENLKITVNEINQADEISFTYYRKVDGKDTPLFDKLDDLSVVLVDGYGYFEIAIEKNENSSVTKSVTGISLGHAELSQILTTLEINTDDDMNRSDYDENLRTVFYRSINEIIDAETEKKYRESSLLHRILSSAPHYKIGTVSQTLWQIQRTFSWSDADILTIFSDISKEINCAFDIQIYLENGKPQRVINVYDMQYCDSCYNELDDSQKTSSNTYKYRTIIGGVCQNCKSSEHIKDIGMDTNIFISTENLSDEISIRSEKDSIKNCFKVIGGDDLITAAVQGLAMSASDRIMKFSEKQKQEMSPDLKKMLDQYDKEYQDSIDDYEKLLETEYNIFDIKHYLRSSKMPPHEKEILKTDQALYTVLKKINEYYNNKFFIKSYDDYNHNAARISLKNMFSSFMPEGYSFSTEGSTITDKTDPYNSNMSYHWYGKIKIYSTGNRDDSYTLHLQPSQNTYVSQGENEEPYTFSDSSMQNAVDNFSIIFSFADRSTEEYIKYIEHHTQYILSTIDQSYDNEIKRPWNLYSYNRLESYYDGYERCIDSLMDLQCSKEKDSENYNILTNMIISYHSIQKDIQKQMDILLEQIFAICAYHGEYDPDFLDADGRIKYSLKYHEDLGAVFRDMLDPSCSGGYQDDQNKTYRVNKFIGTKPFQCKKCGSSNVSESTNGNICSNPGCESSDIYTYHDIMKNIYDSYCSHKNDTITNMRETYQKKFNLKNYLNNEQLYAELRSFIREDVYKNDNYISDGLNNTQLIEHAKELRAKAEQELAKACMAQYTIEAPLSSIVGQKPFRYQDIMVNDDYSGFQINNFVRVRIDGVIYKMRIASMGLSFPVTDKLEVTFTNVTNFKGGALNDVKDILDKAASMATSYSYVATQAEKGGAASAQFDTIKKEGLDAALMAVKAGRDQDVVIDGHGILLRRKIQETDTYSQYQMKLIDRNLVMTDDNWESARLAIGLGMYDKKPVYGVWADLLCGDLIAGKDLIIRNEDENKKCTVRIDKSGITLDGGTITWLNPINKDNAITSNAVAGLNDFKNSVNGSLGVTTITSDSVIAPKIGGGYLYIANNNYSVEIDPDQKCDKALTDYLFAIREKTSSNPIMGVKTNGDAYFNGKINATSGTFNGTISSYYGEIGGWTIDSASIYSGNVNDNHLQLDARGKSLISQNGYEKVVLSSGSLRFLKNNTECMTLSTTSWKNTSTYGVGIHSEAESKFISFGNRKQQTDTTYITPIVLNYGLNPDGLKQDVLIYGSTYFGDEINFNNDVTLSTISWDNISVNNNTYSVKALYCSGGISCENSMLVGNVAFRSNATNQVYKLCVDGTIYASGNIRAAASITEDYDGVASDMNKKHSIEDPDERYLSLFDKVEIKRFIYNNGTSGRYHLGAIAQSVENAVEETGLTDKEFAGVIFDEGSYYLRYDELNMLTALKVKSMDKKYNKIINSLRQEITELKNILASG